MDGKKRPAKLGDKRQPAKQHEVDEWQAELTLSVRDLVGIMRSLSHLSSPVFLRTKEGLVVVAMDPSHITMGRARVRSVEGLESLPVGQGVAISDSKELIVALADIAPRETVTLRFGSKHPELLDLSSDGSQTVVGCIPMERVTLPKVPDPTNMTCYVYLFAGDVLRVARRQSRYSDQIVVSIADERAVRFSGSVRNNKTSEGRQETIYSTNPIRGKLSPVTYPLDFFSAIFQSLVMANGPMGVVTLEAAKDAPLRVEADTSYGEVTYLLAPRVDDPEPAAEAPKKE